jgi:hypothetical protein
VSKRELLVLVHIPKTAGTTLWRIMRHHYRGAWYQAGNAFRSFDSLEPRLAAIGRKRRILAIGGHITFGVRALLPEALYLTILRDPVERTLSHYSYLVKTTGGRAAGLVAPWLPAPTPGLQLEDCLGPRNYIPDNLQTRMLCGIASPYDELPGDALAQAKENLRERFAWVGTTERFDEFLALLDLELGWPTLPYARERAAAVRLRRDQVLPEALRAVEEANALDRELHAYAGDLLERALAAAGPELRTEVEVLRRACEAGGAPIAGLPVEARVALALKEAELARAEAENRDLRKQLKKLRRQAAAQRPAG